MTNRLSLSLAKAGLSAEHAPSGILVIRLLLLLMCVYVDVDGVNSASSTPSCLPIWPTR